MSTRAALFCALVVPLAGCTQDVGLRSLQRASIVGGVEVPDDDGGDALGGIAPTLAWDFSSMAAGTPWEEGAGEAGLINVFDGYGIVAVRAVDGSPALVASPARAADPSETHAALVVSEASVAADMTLRMTARTMAQLRVGEPNPWETAWVVWGYTDPENFYYLALKTNGWEIGKRDPSYAGGQRFLADARDEGFAMGQAAAVEVEQDGGAMSVWVDGFLLAELDDTERPLLGGAIGFYTEDAAVAFDDVAVWE